MCDFDPTCFFPEAETLMGFTTLGDIILDLILNLDADFITCGDDMAVVLCSFGPTCFFPEAEALMGSTNLGDIILDLIFSLDADFITCGDDGVIVVLVTVVLLLFPGSKQAKKPAMHDREAKLIVCTVSWQRDGFW